MDGRYQEDSLDTCNSTYRCQAYEESSKGMSNDNKCTIKQVGG